MSLIFVRKDYMVIQNQKEVCVQAALDTSIRDYLVQDPTDLGMFAQNCEKNNSFVESSEPLFISNVVRAVPMVLAGAAAVVMSWIQGNGGGAPSSEYKGEGQEQTKVEEECFFDLMRNERYCVPKRN